MLAGIIINPFFPSNIESYFFNFGRISSSDTSIQVGNEWYPYNTFFLLKDSAFVFILFFGTIGLVLGSLNKKNYILTSTFFVSLFFMVLLFKSRRFVEYWRHSRFSFVPLVLMIYFTTTRKTALLKEAYLIVY